jgi:hypothetical protein
MIAVALIASAMLLAVDCPEQEDRSALFRRGRPKFALQFQISPRGREAWRVVTIGNPLYGAYLDREQALLDAVDAARDAVQAGHEAEVWIRDRSTAARVF